MQQNLTTPELHSYLLSSEDHYVTEKAEIGIIVKSLLANGRKVTNKSIILSLIKELEISSDVVRLDILRSCLEIVLAHTPDDETHL